MKTCSGCGTPEGHLHELYCDMERCPFCGGQLITCGCCYKLLGFDYDFFAPNCGLPQDIYENGLPDDLEDKWVDMLKEKGRIPYIVYPNMCAKCGKLWPEMFRVPDDEWQHYIEPRMRDKMLCRECYNSIKSMIDRGSDNHAPAPDASPQAARKGASCVSAPRGCATAGLAKNEERTPA